MQLTPKVFKVLASKKYARKGLKRIVRERAMTTARGAYWYVSNFRTPLSADEERVVATEAHWSYIYAQAILQGRFPAGEEAISKDAKYACHYAVDVIKGPWPEAEEVLARDPEFSMNYVHEVLKLKGWEAESWWLNRLCEIAAENYDEDEDDGEIEW